MGEGYAYRCEVCDGDADWRIERVGDVATSWACAIHLRVSYKPIDNPDGTKTERWLCDYGCGATFIPSKRAEATIELTRRNEELQAEKERAEHDVSVWRSRFERSDALFSEARSLAGDYEDKYAKRGAELSSLTEERDDLQDRLNPEDPSDVHVFLASLIEVNSAGALAVSAHISSLTEERDALKEAAQKCYGLLDMLYDRYGHDDWAEGHQDMVNEVLTSRRITERLKNG